MVSVVYYGIFQSEKEQTGTTKQTAVTDSYGNHTATYMMGGGGLKCFKLKLQNIDFPDNVFINFTNKIEYRKKRLL